MNVSSLSIRRPVLATVMSVIILLFGIIGVTFLGVREYPSVDPPIIDVTTIYPGANADVIESQITEPLEQSINGIAGIRTLTSVSRPGRSSISVEFDLDIGLEDAANDVRDKVSQAVGNLPPDAEPPIVSKADADANPIMFITFSSPNRDLLELTQIAELTFKERLQTIPGVSNIMVWGSKRYSMRLWMDPDLLAAYQLTPLDVRDALLRENIELPSGRIEGNNTELTIRTLGLLKTPEEFNNLVIKESNERVVRFRDIGYAELGPENERTILKSNGKPMVGNAIVPQPGSNHIEIADEVYRRLDIIKKDLPRDIAVGVGFDTTTFIRDSISEVQQTIYIAFFLVVVVIFLFLRDWRTTLIPVIVIPISLVGAFFVMYVAGFSINVLTLLGIVLAIGLVVDDAIVVMENIYSKIEAGESPLMAGIKGSAEIFFAIVATTITLVAVFFPIIFLEGLSGRLFREFSIVLAGAVIISSFVALTLTPMISTRLLKVRKKQNWFYRKTEPFFDNLTNGYKNLLSRVMNHRWVALVIILASVGLLVYLGSIIPSELAPLEDRSALLISTTAPEGATFEYMDRYMNELTAFLMENVPEYEHVVTVTSPGFGSASSVNSGFIRFMLKEPGERKRSQQEIAAFLNNELSKLTGARSFVIQEQTIGRSRGLPVQYVLQADNLSQLKEVLPAFLDSARKRPEFQYVDVDLKFNKPEIEVSIDREKANTMGVSAIDIARTLQLALSGQRFAFFIMDGKQYQVIGQLKRENRNEPLDLRSLYVRSRSGEMIQLDNLVTLSEESSPPQLYRYNRYVSATVSASLAGKSTIQQGIDAMDEVSAGVLDTRFQTSLAGASKDFAESASSLVFAFAMALVLIYLVLAAQFESFRDPLIIMFTVPLALAGALITLWYFDETLNIFSQIGIIMLIGLVAKNGILIVEFANQRKNKGLSRFDAINEAAAARFRPILMTSLSTVLGVLPIALALGAGAESRISMGLAVIGGLIFSTILTLFVIPAAYTFISEKTGRKEINLSEPETQSHIHE